MRSYMVGFTGDNIKSELLKCAFDGLYIEEDNYDNAIFATRTLYKDVKKKLEERGIEIYDVIGE